jgi:hypothetical protein
VSDRQIGNYPLMNNAQRWNLRATYSKQRTRDNRAKALSRVKISLAPDAKEISEIK